MRTKVKISLSNIGGELDSQTVRIDGDDADEFSAAIIEALKTWALAPGDTIEIIDLEQSA